METDFDPFRPEPRAHQPARTARATALGGARSLSQVRYAILEVTGELSIFLNDREPVEEDLLDNVT